MAYVLDTTTTDSYQELRCPGTTRVLLQISGAKVLVGFGTSYGGGSAVYPADEPFLPVVGSVQRDCDAIRIKSAVPGVPATATITANP